MTVEENPLLGRGTRLRSPPAAARRRRTAEQNALAALTLADHAYVIDLGRTTLSGPARQLLADPCVREAYLG
jgi:hypothetical protein